MVKLIYAASVLSKLGIIFSLLTFCGFLFLFPLYKKRNKLLLLGASMISGPLIFVALLSFLSYVFKGWSAIRIIFATLVFTCLFVFVKKIVQTQKFKRFLKFNYHRSSVFSLLVISLYIVMLFLFVSGSSTGGDVEVYWGIATSFSKGNYPTVLPWQPNYLTVYHQGTFILEGAIYALTNLDISDVHFFFSFYILVALFIFVSGIAREKVRNVFCTLPAIITLTLFGGPVLLTKNIGNFLRGMITSFGVPGGLIGYLTTLPDYGYFTAKSGAGAVNLWDLIYINFYTFGFAVFLIFLFFYIQQIKRKFSFRNYFILVSISVLTCSIDETFFLIEIPLLIILYILQVRKFLRFGWVRPTILLFISFLFLMLIVQNPIRDSFLTPSPEQSRFKLLFETGNEYVQKIAYGKDGFVSKDEANNVSTVKMTRNARMTYSGSKNTFVENTGWFMLGLKTVIVVVLVFSLLAGSLWPIILSISSLLSYFFSLVLVNTYWPDNAYRVINQAANLIFLALAFLSIELLFNKRKNMVLKILCIAFLIFLTPQFLVGQAKLVKGAFYGEHTNFTISKKDPLLQEIANSILPLKRVVYLDTYTSGEDLFSYYNLVSATKYGVFVPMSPVDYKVIYTESSIEWYDAINSLSPPSFKILQVDYVYVRKVAQERLSPLKKQYLQKEDYFIPIKYWEDGSLYKVADSFKELDDEEDTLKNMTKLVEEGSRVYIDRFYLQDIRKALIVELAKKSRLVGPIFSVGGDFFMYIEKSVSFEPVCDRAGCGEIETEKIKGVDFAFMGLGGNPESRLEGKYEKIASIKYVDLWIRIDK